jgi:hypothetical protein
MTVTTMNLIAKQTVGESGASSITFSNIPQTYTDLKIVGSSRDNENGNYNNILLSFNGSSSNLSAKLLYGYGSGAGSADSTSAINYQYSTAGTATANTFSNFEIYISNYTSSNYKSMSVDGVTENNATAALTSLEAGLWSNSVAINSITFTPASSKTFQQYTTFSLYGISSNTTTQIYPKASGGDVILNDGTYWWHAFKNSGTFTANQALTADILAVAGGGGGSGGDYGGAGGGAGGLLALASQSISTGSYAITVGAGGPGTTQNTNGVSGGDSYFASLTHAIGGGGGGGVNGGNGVTGGSGGGGGNGGSSNGGSGTAGQGNNGGGGYPVNPWPGGGGGGAGSAGANATSGIGGNGGDGSSTYSSWGLATSTGDNRSGTVYFAGGGGGGLYISGSQAGSGGYGGGGAGKNQGTGGSNATANTGGGGGGAGAGNTGTNGGSGIIIVRYAI